MLWRIGLIVSLAACIACTNGEKNQEQQSTIPAEDTLLLEALDTVPLNQDKFYEGNYVSGEYPKGYYQLLTINGNASSRYEVNFTASKVKGKAACQFQGIGIVEMDTLKVPVEWNGKTIQMTLFLRNDTVQVFTENFDDRFALNYFCSGGAALSGDYVRVQSKDQ